MIWWVEVAILRIHQGRILIFSQEGWKNFRWGASYMQYAILDALEGA